MVLAVRLKLRAIPADKNAKEHDDKSWEVLACTGIVGAGRFRADRPFGLGGVSSTYGLGNTTFGSVQYAITISIEYNTSLTAASYISPAQFTTDYQGFLNAYPNPGDPPEAMLLSAAQSFAQQYSQFSVVTLDATAGSAAASGASGSAATLQAEIEATASNIQVGTLDRHNKTGKAVKSSR